MGTWLAPESNFCFELPILRLVFKVHLYFLCILRKFMLIFEETVLCIKKFTTDGVLKKLTSLKAYSSMEEQDNPLNLTSLKRQNLNLETHTKSMSIG